MPHSAAAWKTFRACSSSAAVTLVLIIGTLRPKDRRVFTAGARSRRAFSGSTWPPGRTVRSTPSNPISRIRSPASATLRVPSIFENMIHCIVFPLIHEPIRQIPHPKAHLLRVRLARTPTVGGETARSGKNHLRKDRLMRDAPAVAVAPAGGWRGAANATLGV